MDDLDAWMTQAQQQDDKQSFAHVVRHCHHLLRATVLRDTADAELADEIAQDALVRAWTRRHQYRPGTSPRAWLLAITRSRLMEHHRRQDRDRRHLHDLIRSELLRHTTTTDSDARRSARIGALQVCIGELQEHNRELLDLVHAQGLTTEAAAEVLGIKPTACRQRLSRLQRGLRRCAERRLEETGG